MSEHVKEITQADFEAEVAKSTLPVVLDFFSTVSAPPARRSPRSSRRWPSSSPARPGSSRSSARATGTSPPAWASPAAPTLIFFKGGAEVGERMGGEEIKRTAIKAQVEAMLGA